MRERHIETSASPLPRRIARIAGVPALIAWALLGWATPARAHDALSEYVWHRLELTADARHLNVIVTLTFFEDWSERERRRMDVDGDGRISRSEIDRYATELSAALKSRVELTITGRRVALVPLYAPTVELPAGAGVERAHHKLTLHYFAPLPSDFSPGAEIVIEDCLWDEAPSFAEIEVDSTGDGARFEPTSERSQPNPERRGPLRFSARFLKPARSERPAQ